MAVDLRGRIQPPLLETYLGNLIFPVYDGVYIKGTAIQTGEDADSVHLTQLALHIRTRLASINETVVYSATVAEYDS